MGVRGGGVKSSQRICFLLMVRILFFVSMQVFFVLVADHIFIGVFGPPVKLF